MKLLKTCLFIAILFIVSNVQAQEVTEKVKKKMARMDVNKDNAVDLAEFKEFYIGKTNKKGEAIKTDLLFLALDENDDNKIGVEELAKKPNWKAAKQKMKNKKN